MEINNEIINEILIVKKKVGRPRISIEDKLKTILDNDIKQREKLKQLNYHRKYYNSKKEDYECPLCIKTIANKLDLNRHQKSKYCLKIQAKNLILELRDL